MEPQYLQLGQAAGFAAAIAVDRGAGFSQSLATPIRAELAKANGFKGITSICLKMNGDLRKYWGFVESNCITKNIGLVIAN
jgi:hypothetical protein